MQRGVMRNLYLLQKELNFSDSAQIDEVELLACAAGESKGGLQLFESKGLALWPLLAAIFMRQVEVENIKSSVRVMFCLFRMHPSLIQAPPSQATLYWNLTIEIVRTWIGTSTQF